MVKYVDGEYIEMTDEEIAEFELQQQQFLNMPHLPTENQRLSALENAFAEFVISFTGGNV